MLVATHAGQAAQAAKERMEPVRSLLKRASLLPLLESDPFDPCLCAALLAQAGGERETRAGERFETGDALGQVGRKRLTMDVKESYTEPEDETGR